MPDSSLTRRQFTLDAALILLAGCVITVSEACSGNKATSPSPTVSDVSGVVSANHGHAITVTAAQITAGNAVSATITGTATHPHTVTISQADLLSLKNRQAVNVTSSTDNGHQHTITFTPA